MNLARGLLVLLLIPLTGCTSVSLVESTKMQSPEKSFRNFLVVGVSGTLQNRQVFEEIICAELKKRGVAATASYTLTSGAEQLSRSIVEKAAVATKADAVLATRLSRINNEKQGSVGYEMTDRGRVGNTSYATFDMKPVEITTSMTYVLETNLFDATTQDRVWSGVTNFVDPQGIITISEKFSALVVDALNKEGFIQ